MKGGGIVKEQEELVEQKKLIRSEFAYLNTKLIKERESNLLKEKRWQYEHYKSYI